MMISDIIWWLGVVTLSIYGLTTLYIMAGIAIRYYRRRK